MSEQADRDAAPKQKGKAFFLLKARATKPGETYGVPGQGDTLWLSALSIAGIIFVWWLVTTMGWVKPLFLPSPQAVLSKFMNVWQNGFTNTPFLEHVGVSAARVFGAFLLACLVGIPLGIAMGMSPVARGIFDPPLEFYRPIPPLAYLPLMIIWFGIGETSKVLSFETSPAPMLARMPPPLTSAITGESTSKSPASCCACTWASRSR